jgi:hypothetical protein
MNSLLNTTSNTRFASLLGCAPLDDHPEQKRDVSAVGTMAMTPSVRLSLFALRAYLILMTSLVAYHLSRPCDRAQASDALSRMWLIASKRL